VPTLTEQSQKLLDHQSAGAYMAQLFAESTPDFVQCKFNSAQMIEYMEARKLPLNVENFRKAFAALTKLHKLWPSPPAMENMSPTEIRKLMEEIGIPRYDARGKVIGYDWPDGIPERIREEDQRWKRERTPSNATDYSSADLRLVGYRPSKRELAGWSSDRLQLWMRANELTDIPDYLKK
jgi:hypothetical protein